MPVKKITDATASSGSLKTIEFSSCLSIRRAALWEPFEKSLEEIHTKSSVLVYEGMIGMGGKWFISEARRYIEEMEKIPLLTGDDILRGTGGGVFLAEYFPSIGRDRKKLFCKALEPLLKKPGTLVVISLNEQCLEPCFSQFKSMVTRIAIPAFTREETRQQLARLRYEGDMSVVNHLTGGNPWINSVIALLGPEKGIDFAYEYLFVRLAEGNNSPVEQVAGLYSMLQEKEVPILDTVAAATLNVSHEELYGAEQALRRQFCFSCLKKGGRRLALPLQKTVLTHFWQQKGYRMGWKRLNEQVERYMELYGQML